MCEVNMGLGVMCGDMLNVLFGYMNTRDICRVCVALNGEKAWELFIIRRDADDCTRLVMGLVRHYILAEKLYLCGGRRITTNLRVPNERSFHLDDVNVDENARLVAGIEYRRSYWESVQEEGFEESEFELLDASELYDESDELVDIS
jgi:hypothetical protein